MQVLCNSVSRAVLKYERWRQCNAGLTLKIASKERGAQRIETGIHERRICFDVLISCVLTHSAKYSVKQLRI